MRFVQIGTSSAKDDVFNFIKDQDIELGVLVEPLEEHRQSILNCYEGIENIHLEQVAVRWDDVREVQFYSSELHLGASSFRKKHLIRHRIPMEKIDTRVVKCIHIHELFDKYKIDYLDHLFTDTEGFDGDLLLSNYNFEKMDKETQDAVKSLINHLMVAKTEKELNRE